MTMLLDTPTRNRIPERRARRRQLRRRPLLLSCALLAPTVGFLAAYLLFFTPNSPSRFTLSPTKHETVETAMELGVGTWTVAPGSAAGYRVREKLLRLPAPNDAVGRTEAVRGSFELTRAGRQYRVKSGLRVEIDVATLRSDEPRRDEHMRTMAIETDLFPTAAFVSTADLLIPDAVVAAGMGRVSIDGELTLHGTTRAVTILVDVQRNGSQIEAVGSMTFAWDLFEIPPPNLSYVTVEDRPTLEFRLLFEALHHAL